MNRTETLAQQELSQIFIFPRNTAQLNATLHGNHIHFGRGYGHGTGSEAEITMRSSHSEIKSMFLCKHKRFTPCLKRDNNRNRPPTSSNADSRVTPQGTTSGTDLRLVPSSNFMFVITVVGGKDDLTCRVWSSANVRKYQGQGFVD
jgi:hypothetical protein